MAKKASPLEVKKFEGTTEVGKVRMVEPTVGPEDKLFNYDLNNVAVESRTKLEDDHGFGDAAIIRRFEFGMNPEAFKQHTPTKQELFNYHHKGIEMALFRDGLKVLPEVNPRLIVNEATKTYSIFVTARPMRGQMLNERPQTLTEIAHGRAL